MGNDLNQWRCSIGLFHNRLSVFSESFTITTKVSYWFYVIFLNILKLCIRGFSSVRNSFLNLQLCVVLLLLLLQAGDIETNPGPISNDHSLSIVHCNIRSIRQKLEHVRDSFLDFDILCFTETHLDLAVSDEFLFLSDSHDAFYRKDRTNHGGGILVYLAKNIIHSRLPGLETFCPESVWVSVNVNKEKYLIGTFYSPKTSDPDFFSNFNKNIEKALEISQNLVILGDLNEDLLNPNLKKLKDILILNSLKNIISEPTRRHALLDPIIVPTDMRYLDSGIIPNPPEISDHSATYIYLPFHYEIKQSFERLIYLYKRADFDKLNNEISNYDWQVLRDGNLNESTEFFNNVFLQFVNSCIPSKRILVRSDDKPWFDSELRKFCRIRDRLRKQAMRTGKQNILNKYKEFRNKVNNMKKHAKQNFFNSLEISLENLSSNDKKGFWRIIKYFVKNNDCSSNIPPLCSTSRSGEVIQHLTNYEKADCLNEYFSSISSINDQNASLPVFTAKTNNFISDIYVTEAEIYETILSLNVNKACGPDSISHKMLKGVAKSICKPLALLFNRSINEGIFPDCWKVANVVPIFKKGDRSSVTNYRPVSLLSCCGKLFERVVFKYMYNFFLDNNLLYKYQSGFLPGHSTTFQLIDIFHHICQSFDNRQYSCMVFCDISKAFDRVWHKGLLFKLQQNGITGKLLNWLSNYLTNRRQKVVIQSAESSLKPITAGVPQGSVLGPLLFLIYVNDISESLLSLTRLFADDSSLYYSTTSIDDIEGLINHDLRLISNWAKKWLVNFNPNKTEAVLFSLKPYDRLPSLVFENTNIQFVENHKHLGVTLNSKGQWNAHIDTILQSASKVIGIMRKLKFSLNRKSLNQIYLSYICPTLEYASIVWDGCSDNCSESLQKLQNEAARIVTGLTRSVSLANLYRECGWETLANRRKTQKLNFMYKATHDMVPPYIAELIPPTTSETNQYNLRNQNYFRNILVRTSVSQKSCIPSSIDLWNDLDPNIRNSNSLATFKLSLSGRHLPNNVPSYYLVGNRYLSVLHARIRNNCSNLNNDLFHNRLRESPLCACLSGEVENAEHYLLRCNFFGRERVDMFRVTRSFHPLNVETLLFGRSDLTHENNVVIFKAVQEFIKKSGRF